VCTIVPLSLLRRLANDPSIDENTRLTMRATFVETSRMRVVRDAARVATLSHRTSLGPALDQAVPQEQIYDCKHGQSLPGTLIAAPSTSPDIAVSTVYTVTSKVARFYRDLLKRNSVDDHGLDLVSSIHYRMNYDNAFWNGQQMVYGDGDGEYFSEFYRSPDVIAHELTHGVTQYESGLQYEGEPGALNESISDVFGAVFNQWFHQWPVTNRDGWLIGAGILGPKARQQGKTCLRDMAEPGAAYCLTPQPDTYDQFDPTADVHDNSGIPNHAFALFTRALGGPSWGQPIQVWYQACTDRRLRPNATFEEFAGLTIKAGTAIGGQALADEVQMAWEKVRVPLKTLVT